MGSNIARRMVYKYAANAVSFTDADAPLGASGAAASNAGGIFVLHGISLGSNDSATTSGVLAYDDGDAAIANVLGVSPAGIYMGLDLVFNLKHVDATLTLTVTTGTTRYATIIGYWLPD